MDKQLEIRQVQPQDAAKLVEIYTPYVLNTAITFEYSVPTVEDFTERIRKISARYPYYVATLNNEIVGYAYASAFKGRAAYDWSVELSVYVSEYHRKEGIGTALYWELEKTLKKQNVCNLCACISYPNPGSVEFHQSMGYKTVAHFHNSGYKFDTWYDMIWMEKFINEHTSHQKPFLPVKEIL